MTEIRPYRSPSCASKTTYWMEYGKKSSEYV